MDTNREKIIELLKNNKPLSSKEIFDIANLEISYATLKRILTKLVGLQLLNFTGNGKARKYTISESYDLFYPIDVETYYKKEIDERIIKKKFNESLLKNVLPNIDIFTTEELKKLNGLQEEYAKSILNISNTEYAKELERLAIDLSWKSSQIEGNTYSLLETERLLKEQETALGKKKDEAVMLLNHKVTIDFIVKTPDYVFPLSLSKIEDIHSLLIKDLGVDRNIRKRRVGISGTNYQPLDNEYQIREALEQMCLLINTKVNVFEKAFLILVLISYIQGFSDGNKRTARILSNAILIHFGYCPISFRTVNSIDYKKAMLLFYEQNNMTACKEIFINQFEFAVQTYF
ncbi:MAG: Fic family protein [Polaribacter sp.]